ncbi:sensor histidine kinase [Marinobacter sp. JSM 1782161]|uniref:sensor histidine kinase n=1 Tax=Marinobacter sp. JSM 1782161 TaxID=2685906 RepID=UPI0014022765|nr:sensor histidine kinase [Marinobacter sp. JSM 1782161]
MATNSQETVGHFRLIPDVSEAPAGGEGLSAHLTRHRLFYQIWLSVSALILLAAIFGYQTLVQLRLDPITTQQTATLDSMHRELTRELGYLQRVPRLIRAHPDVGAALSRNAPVDRDRLEQAFIYLQQLSPLISQLRWIDANGQEQARVNFGPDGAQPAPDNRLQGKAHRTYVQETLQLDEQSVYLSPINLNVENQLIVRPFEPTLRAAIRTGSNQGMYSGLLVANVNLAPLLDDIRRHNNATSQVQLLDERGYWLVHGDPGREWGHVLGRNNLSLNQAMPELWQQISGRERLSGVIVDGNLWSARSVAINTGSGTPERRLIALTGTRGYLAGRIATTTGLMVAATALLLSAVTGALAMRLSDSLRAQANLGHQLQQDKTELNDAYNQLLQAHKETQYLQDEVVEARKLSSLGTLVSGVAHELGLPAGNALITIDNVRNQQLDLLERLASGARNPDELDRMISASTDGLERAQSDLRQVVERVSSFKRLAVDRSRESLQLFRLAGRLEDLVRTMEAQLNGRNITLELQVPADLTLRSFPGLISQLVQNLIENAVTHAFTNQTSGHVLVWARPLDSEMFQLEVRDNGSGIPPHIRTCLFDPFVTSARDQGHAGLGLYQIHQWVTLILHGRVSIDSTAGNGTRVTLSLPVYLSR